MNSSRDIDFADDAGIDSYPQGQELPKIYVSSLGVDN